jgi:hypothetical protein
MTTDDLNDDPVNVGPKQEGRDERGRFKPGYSGNPAGMAKGTRHRATRIAETLIDEAAQSLTELAIEKAFGGDMVAMRLCLERLIPPRKDRPVSFELPTINTVEDASKASGALLAAVAAGELTPGEAGEISKLLDVHVRTIEVTEFEARIRKLEEAR